MGRPQIKIPETEYNKKCEKQPSKVIVVVVVLAYGWEGQGKDHIMLDLLRLRYRLS